VNEEPVYPNENVDGVYLINTPYNDYMRVGNEYSDKRIYHSQSFSNLQLSLLLKLYHNGGLLFDSEYASTSYPGTIKALRDSGHIEEVMFKSNKTHEAQQEHYSFIRLSVIGHLIVKENREQMENDILKEGYWLASQFFRVNN